MEWWITLIIIIGLLMAFFLSGMPVAFGFLSLNIIGLLVFMGGIDKLRLLIPSSFASIGHFALVVIPLFILMGEVLFQTGLGKLMVDNVAKWVGRVRGSLSLVTVTAGTIFAMMSGAGVAGVALFGSTMGPEMESRGYSKEMTYGPILGAACLAVMIPPSILIVVVATISQQSVGSLLIAAVIPGFIMAGLYAVYFLVRGWLQPHLAPSFSVPHITWGQRFKALAVISPLIGIIVLVLLIIFLGIATPSEAAAIGVTGAFILAAAYRKLTWEATRKALLGTIKVTAMVFMILLSASAFSQLLAFTGTIREMGMLATSLPVSPILIVVVMQVIMIIMGMFIDDFSIIMIATPIFFPVIRSLGLDPMWFGILMAVNMEMATITPPFGIFLFALKGVLPNATMGDVYRAGIPIFFLVLLLLVLLLFVPSLVTWLPTLMLG